jgi:membrane protease YdiL (CAAX protease family)
LEERLKGHALMNANDGELTPPTNSPAGATVPLVCPEEAQHYGKVGKVPWTLGQTLVGAGVTIVPWLLLLGLSQSSTTAGAGTGTGGRLAPAVDILNGIIFVLFMVVVEGVFLLAALIIAVRSRTPGTTRWGSLRALGLRATPLLPALGWILLGIVVVIAVTIGYGIVVQVFHLPLQTNAETLNHEAKTMPFTVLGALIGAVFIAPFCEEIFFRGFLFAGLLRGMNVVGATLVATVLFTLVHGDIGSAVPLFAIGIMLAVIRWRTGSVWPGIGLHMLNNGIAAVAVIATISGMAPH